MSFADSLRQQATWIREKLQGRGPIREWEDIDLDELEAAALYLDQVQPLIEAMDQLLDDMGPNGKSVCLAAKAQARIAFEPFLDPDAAEFIMPLDEAKRIAKEAGL